MGTRKSPNFPTSVWVGPANEALLASQFEEMTPNEKMQLIAEVVATQNFLFPGPWTDVTPANSWTLGSVHAGYRLIGNDVLLRGSLTAGTTTDATTLFTLPVGYRPAHVVTIPVQPTSGGTAGDASARILIGTDGTVKCYGLSTSTDLSFGNVRFALDQ